MQLGHPLTFWTIILLTVISGAKVEIADGKFWGTYQWCCHFKDYENGIYSPINLIENLGSNFLSREPTGRTT